MSRIGRSPIALPQGVEVKIGEPGQATVKGPKGSLEVVYNPRLVVKIEGGELNVTRPTESRTDRAQHGLARTLIYNAVLGVTEGYEKKLEIHGVGFRCQNQGTSLELSLGFSHPVVIEAPEGIKIEATEPTRITVSGIDKQMVGQVAANIRAVRPPDSYHGKGVRYVGEAVRLKAGKTAAR